MARPILVAGGCLVAPNSLVNNAAVLLDAGRIAWAGPADAVPALPIGTQIINVDGGYITPGFIDIHVHGGGGADTMDGTSEAFNVMARCHAAGGTTSFVATTVTAPIARLQEIARLASRCIDQPTGGARLVGIHLEGPFLAEEQIGAHDIRYRLDPAADNFLGLLAAAKGVKRITLAPELPGALQLIIAAVEQGWHVAMGHSNAHGESVSAALQAGCRHVTHLFSCTSGLLNHNGSKWPGINEWALLSDDITVELIVDGHHLSGEFAALVARCKGIERTCLATDAMRAAGLGPGMYDLGGVAVLVEDGVAKLPDRSRFAGSVATMDMLVRELVRGGGDVHSACVAASATPARLIGLSERKGALEPGKDADVAVLSPELQTQITIVAGEVVFQRGQTQA